MTDLTLDDASRRRLLRRLLALAGASSFGLTTALQMARAAAGRPEASGIYDMKGMVQVNRLPAKPGSIVLPGDTVTTGAASYAIFVIGLDAYMLRENSRMEIAGQKTLVQRVKLNAGRLLSVLAPGLGPRRFETTTAVIGVRGTGLYLATERERTYACTCYGETELSASADPTKRETVRTRHHESPRYIYADPKRPIEPAKVIDHTDEELILLESLVARTPPFVGQDVVPYKATP
jgi:ribosomal 50S subunit-recycling heat shock protein